MTEQEKLELKESLLKLVKRVCDGEATCPEEVKTLPEVTRVLFAWWG